MSVVDAELVSLDRAQQTITLSNNQKLLYGMLVITAGLHQTSLPDDVAKQLRVPSSRTVSLKSAESMSTQVHSIALI